MQWNKVTANIMTDDMDKTLAFYRDLLGFRVEMKVPDEPPYVWCQLNQGDVELMFQSRASLASELPEFQEILSGGALTLYFEIGDVRALVARLTGKVTVVKDVDTTFYGATEWSIRDPNGLILTFATHY